MQPVACSAYRSLLAQLALAGAALPALPRTLSKERKGRGLLLCAGTGLSSLLELPNPLSNSAVILGWGEALILIYSSVAAERAWPTALWRR